jgi:Outer membrane protein beta-barrel domain
VLKSIGLFALLFVPAALLAQSPRSAIGGDAGLWAGGEVSDFNPDFGCKSNMPFNCANDLLGATALFDFNVKPRWGAEGEARWLHWNGTGGQVESTYMIGPRYRVYRLNRFSFWTRVVAGGGWTTTPDYPAAGSLKGSYFVFAPGGTVDYRISSRLLVRADYEFQFWPSFAGPPSVSSTGQLTQNNGGLSPNGVSVGVMYRFLPRH